MSLVVVLLILALANVQLAKAAPSLDPTEISSTYRNVESSTEAGTENVLGIWTADESTTKIDSSEKAENSEQPAVEKSPDSISAVTTEKLNSNSNQEGDSDKVRSDSKIGENNEISGQQVKLASDTNSSKTIQNDTDKWKSSDVESSSSDSLDPEYLDFDSSIPDPINSDSQNTESSNLDTINPDPSKTDSSKTDSLKLDFSNPDVLNKVSLIKDTSDSDSSNTDPSKTDSLNLDSSKPGTLNTVPLKQNTLKPESSNADDSKASVLDRSNPDSSKADSFISDSSDPEFLKTDSANPDLSYLHSSNTEPLKPEFFSPNPLPSNTDTTESTNPDSPILNYPDSNSNKSDSSGNCDCDRPEKSDSSDSFGPPDSCECPREPEKSTITDILVKFDSLDNALSDSPVELNKPEKSNELENSNRLDKLAKKDANNSKNTVSIGIEIDEELDTPASDDAGQKGCSYDDSEILAPGETDFLEFSTVPSFPSPLLGIVSWIPPQFMTFDSIFPRSPFNPGYQQLLSSSFPHMPFDLGFPLAGLGFPPINGLGFPPSAALGFPPLPSSPYISDASTVSGSPPLNSPIFSKLLIDVGLPLTPSLDLGYSEDRLFVYIS